LRLQSQIIVGGEARHSREAKKKNKAIGQMRYLLGIWRGDLPLNIAFWNWAVAGGLVVNIISSALFLFLMLAKQPILAVIVGYVLSLPYNLIVTVGVWRSAERYEGDIRWAHLAQAITVIGMIVLSVT
jgi:hypothetical protein